MLRARVKEFLFTPGVYWILSLAFATLVARIGFTLVSDAAMRRYVAEYPQMARMDWALRWMAFSHLR